MGLCISASALPEVSAWKPHCMHPSLQVEARPIEETRPMSAAEVAGMKSQEHALQACSDRTPRRRCCCYCCCSHHPVTTSQLPAAHAPA